METTNNDQSYFEEGSNGKDKRSRNRQYTCQCFYRYTATDRQELQFLWLECPTARLQNAAYQMGALARNSTD
jgi:hypothetical protein